jgi:hypothetical protein
MVMVRTVEGNGKQQIAPPHSLGEAMNHGGKRPAAEEEDGLPRKSLIDTLAMLVGSWAESSDSERLIH